MAAQVDENDARIETETVSFAGASGDINGYLARPKGADSAPGLVIIHENKGLTPHIKDVARRGALEGFITLAPDFLTPAGGTPDLEADGPARTKSLDMAKTIGDGLAAVDSIRTRSDSNGKVGTIGFCWGGGLSNQIAVHDPNLDAGIVFYGRSPKDEDAAKIKARLLLNYGSLDENITPSVAAYEAALKAAGVDHRIFIYDGGKHGFHNDENAERYHGEHSKTAWQRSIEFMKETLGS